MLSLAWNVELESSPNKGFHSKKWERLVDIVPPVEWNTYLIEVFSIILNSGFGFTAKFRNITSWTSHTLI